MATNKNALIRYKVLDSCFRNPGRRYFIDDLIGECEKVLLEIEPNSNGISRRQILDDISFMESKEGWGIELTRERQGRRVFYHYTQAGYSINDMPLNELEINQLRTAATIISQFKGMPQFEWVNELIPKLKQGIASNEAASTIIEFENNQYLKGIDRLGSLHNAIFYKKVLEIAYQPYENEIPFNLIFHPYFLKQYNSRWFLFGYNPERGKYDWNLAIDRIVDLKETNIKYQKNSAINWQEYFDDIIGVTKPESAEIENITLHFLGKTGKYLETKPLHGSQKSRWLSTNVLEVKLSLIANYELEHLLLSYADSVKIMGPKNLQSKIIKRLSDAASIYDQKLSKSPQV